MKIITTRTIFTMLDAIPSCSEERFKALLIPSQTIPTGFVMTIRDKVNKQFRVVKVCFDICCIVLGFVLGGKLGIITIMTALAAGPVIQFLAEIVQKQMEKTGLFSQRR